MSLDQTPPDLYKAITEIHSMVGGLDAKFDDMSRILHGNDNESGLVKRTDRLESAERKYFKMGAWMAGVFTGAMGVIGFFVAKAQALAAIAKINH